MHRKIAKALIIGLMTAALALTGTVPSFGAQKALDNNTDNYAEPPAIDSTSAIIMDAGSGKILYEKNAYEKRDPASITKILNCMVVLDTLDMSSEVTVDIEPESEGSIMNLKKGETLKVKDLVYGMMLWSANDAAEVLAYAAGGDIDTFCDMMNERAKACGAKDTAYTNPNGLNDEAVNNVTTAYDLALIARSAMNNPDFAKIVGTSKYTIKATNKSGERKHRNSDRCLWDTKSKVEIDGVETPMKYDGCIGVKTGYSSTAGDCFVGCVKRGNTKLITVVLNASHEAQKFQDTINLWNYAFANYKTYTVAQMGDVLYEQKVKRGDLAKVDLGLDSDLKITVDRNSKPSETVTTKVIIDKQNLDGRKIKAPIKKGTALGQIIVYNNGKKVASRDLVTMENVKKGGPLSYIGIADENVFEFFLILAGAIAALIVIIFIIKIRRQINRERRRARNRRSIKREERERERNPFGDNDAR